MTGPEHLREGKRLLGQCADMRWQEREERGYLAVEAQAHFLAALVAVQVEDKLPDRISWQEAAES